MNSRTSLGRVLRAEALEQRQLMAGDAGVALHHNAWHGRDVNNDLRVTPMDALIVLNELNRNGIRDLAGQEVQPSKFVDVNADNRITSLDALQVINALNRGSGEDVPVVEVMLGLTDDQGNSLLEPGTRTANLGVGEIVNIEVLYTDQRLFGGALGLFTVYTDIIASQTGILEPLITETQVLSLSENFVDARSGSVTLSVEGSPTTSTIPFATIASNPATAIRNALIADFGFAPDEIFTSLETREPRDPNNGKPVGDPFDVYVRFIGDRFVDVDVPNFSIDASGLTTVTGQPVVGSSREIDPRLEDGSINPVAVGFALDTRSRTGGNQNVYTNVRQGSFNDDPNDDILNGFSGIGATGQLNAGGVPSIIGTDPFEPADPPFEAFSIRARVTEPVENFQLSLGIPLEDPNETVLVIYGNRPDGTPGDARGLSPVEVVTDQDATVTINVTQAVTARPDPLTVNEDATGTINVLANDSNEGTAPLTIQSVTNGTNGTVTFSNGSVTYTPALNFFGTDSFTYVAVNGDGDTATGTVNVTVTPVNDAPEAEDFQITVTEGTLRVLANSRFTENATAGPANEQQQAVLVDIDNTGTLGTAVLNADGSVSYTAPAGYQGPDSFQYTISDGVDTVTATVDVVVLDQNDPPVATDDVIDATEDQAITFSEADFAAAILADDVPGPANEIAAGQTVTLVSGDLVGSAGGTIIENTDGTFTYTPPDDVFGDAAETFTYTITDGEFTADGTVTINLAAVNDAPVATGEPLTVDELTSNNELDVLDNDTAGPLEVDQTIRIARIVTAPTNGTATVSGDGQTILYTPNADFTGTDTLTYVVVDAGGLESTVATATIEVVPVIRPRARNDQFTVAEDSGSSTFNVLSNDLANENATPTLVSVGAIPASQGTLARSGNSVVFTPAAEFFGSVAFTYTISDTSNPVIDTPEEIAAATATATITVTAVNDAPTFTADGPVAATEDTSASINASTLLDNDSPGPANESAQSLSIASVASTSTAGGTVSLTGQTIAYAPPANFNGSDTFTYTISDGAGGTVTGTVALTVAAVNDAPVLNLATTLTAAEDTTVNFGSAAVLGNSLPGPATAADERSQTLSITVVGSGGRSAEGGTVSVAGGQITYRAAADFFGTDSFAVTVRDSAGATSVGTVTISVTPVNDPPVVADPDLLAFSKSVATFTPAQLLSASSPGPANEAGQPLTVVAATALPSTTGQVRFNADGSVTYTPREGFVGADTFQITVSDGQLQRPLTVTVDVREFEPSVVSGSVFFDYIASVNNPVRDGIQAAHEPGLQMAHVHLSSAADENVTGAAIEHDLFTDISGEFEFTNVPPGTYQLRLDLPSLVYDGADFAGALGDSDSLQNSFTFTIAEPGGQDASNYNFTLLGYNGTAGNGMDLLVSSYMAGQPELARSTNNGLMGAKAFVGADGSTQWFTGGDGFDGVAAGEINLNTNGSAASLTVVMEDGRVLTGVIDPDRIVVLKDGSGGHVVQIFGALDSFGLQSEGSLDDDELELMRYRSAVDLLLAQEESVL